MAALSFVSHARRPMCAPLNPTTCVTLEPRSLVGLRVWYLRGWAGSVLPGGCPVVKAFSLDDGVVVWQPLGDQLWRCQGRPTLSPTYPHPPDLLVYPLSVEGSPKASFFVLAGTVVRRDVRLLAWPEQQSFPATRAVSVRTAGAVARVAGSSRFTAHR